MNYERVVTVYYLKWGMHSTPFSLSLSLAFPSPLETMAGADPGCDKLITTKRSFINHKSGSQNFSKTTITSPAVDSSFVNTGSGSQHFSGLTIECGPSIWNTFTRFLTGISSHFNHNGTQDQNFPNFSFSKYLQALPPEQTVPRLFIFLCF